MKRKLICFLLSSFVFYLPIERAIAGGNDNSIVILKHLFSFPTDEKKVFISYPTFMVMDQDSNLIIADNMGCQILKFSLSGKVLKIFGRQGQGPGDLLYPNSISCGNNKIFVTEAGNSRIQIFDSNGNYLSSFKVTSPPKSMDYYDGKIYAINISLYDEKEPLVAVYNSKGKILKKFGELVKFKDNLHPYTSNAFLKIYNDRLYVLFTYYPLLRIYNLNGDLLKVYDFKKRGYKDRVPENYEWSKLKAGKKVLHTKYLFKAFDVNREGIFIALYDKDIIIDHYGFDGLFKTRFKSEHKGEPFYVFDFLVLSDKNKNFKFYILNTTDVPKVDVFSIKNLKKGGR